VERNVESLTNSVRISPTNWKSAGHHYNNPSSILSWSPTYTYHPRSAVPFDNRTYPTPTVPGNLHLPDPSVTRDHEAEIPL